MENKRADIEARVASGLLSQLEGESQLIELEAGRLEVLQALAAGLEEAAQATGDPDKIAQAQEFAGAIAQIGYSVEAARTTFGDFARTALDAATDSLANFFDTGITGAESLGAAFKEMGQAIVGELRSIAAQILATAIMKKIAGVFGFGIGFSEGGEVGAFARGGRLGGDGSGTSDSNLAWFSKGEYLVRSAIVEQPGVLGHLEDLNKRGAQAIVSPAVLSRFEPEHFATGGLVDSASSPGADAMGGRLDIGLEEGLVLKALETNKGQRLFVNVAKKNRRALRSALK
jgi:hypothetical protein